MAGLTKAEYTRRWRDNNREHHRELQRRHRQRKYDELILPAKSQPCADCGQAFPPEQMHFDHVRGEKLFNLGHAPRFSREAIVAEIAKCEVRCWSCHTKRHAYPLPTHCKRGHEYTPENTYVRPHGGRECRICIRAAKAAR